MHTFVYVLKRADISNIIKAMFASMFHTDVMYIIKCMFMNNLCSYIRISAHVTYNHCRTHADIIHPNFIHIDKLRELANKRR